MILEQPLSSQVGFNILSYVEVVLIFGVALILWVVSFMGHLDLNGNFSFWGRLYGFCLYFKGEFLISPKRGGAHSGPAQSPY